MPLWASVLVATTLTAPAAWAGVVAVIDVLFTRVTPVAAVPPKLTVAPVRKPAPVMVTVVPPMVVPELGVIRVTLGAGLDVGLGELDVFGVVVPPPQPGNSSARSNREQTGNKYPRDIRER